MQERREARQFEPPPWEVDQFEQLKRKDEQQPTDVATVVEPHGDTAPVGQPAVSRESRESRESMGEAAAAVLIGSAKDASPQWDADKQADHEAAMTAMIAQLAAEEPKTAARFIRAGTIAAVVFALVGLVIAVWGVAAIANVGKSGRVAMAGGAGMLALGGLFFGAGAWIVVTNLRKRGFI